MQLEVVKKIAEEMNAASFNHIEPVLGGGNSRIFRLDSGDNFYALKFFRTDIDNTRDRFDAETSALHLFADNAIKCVPKIIVQDRENNCIMMEWINGKPVSDFGSKDINALSGFVKSVHEILPPGGEIYCCHLSTWCWLLY